MLQRCRPYSNYLPTMLLFVATCGNAFGQDNSSGTRAWKTENIVLADGRQLHGVLLSETGKEIEFAEFVRRPGLPLFVVIRPIKKSAVTRSQRLAGSDRRKLVERYNRLRTRSAVELGRMDDIRLTKADGRPARFAFQGEWFALLSTADAETTKRCVVRVEQVVRAYRQWLPPRRKPTSKLRLLVFGSMEEYRSFLSDRGWDVRNPAFYLPDLNMIVAGSDVSRYSERLAKARRQADLLVQKYRSLDANFGKHLKDVHQQLQQAGFNDRQIKSELALRKKSWDDQLSELQREVTRVNRQNEAKFSFVTKRMFARLYHEAFHAYLENYVYPKEKNRLPSWLNEGLAQIFESGQLDDDTLRIDGVNADAMRQLKNDQRRGKVMSLSKVLRADRRTFLRQHADSSSTRSYAYSWALTRWLVSDFGLLRGNRLDQYLSTSTSNAVARFEALVGMPLGEFETKWQNAIRRWK